MSENIPPLPVLVDGPPAAQTPLMHLDSPSRVRRETLKQILRSKTFVLGAIVTLFWVVCAIVGELIAPYDPIDESFAPSYESPTWSHPFGLDRNGRDVFARIIVGARSVIEVAPAATLLGVGLGSMLGLVMGYFGRWVDNVVGRILDAVLAIPLIVLAILILTALSAGNEGISVSSWQLIVVIGIAFTPPVARTVRSAVLAERDLDYVQAAKLRGERAPYIMFAEILPERHGPDHRRGDRAARVRRVQRRNARLPRLRAAAALARLGPPDRRAVRGHLARLVGGRVPVPRDCDARRRDQPRRRLGAAGAGRMSRPILEVERRPLRPCALRDLELVYRVRGKNREVVRGISLTVDQGSSYGLVGESGCGKSTVALSIVRYLPAQRPRDERLARGRGREVLDARGAKRSGSIGATSSRWSTRTPARR